MKASIRTGWGGSTLSFTTEQPEPLAKDLEPDHILVSVKAAAVNPVDYKMPKMMAGPIFGLDFSGTIEAVGSSVSSLKVGDDVFGRCSGSLAEKAILKADACTIKPSSMSFEEAAALPTAHLSAIQALISGRIEPTEKSGLSILVIGASGGTGTAALQLLKGINARTAGQVSRIVAICSSRNSDFVISNGATEVVDYTKADELSTFFKTNEGKFDCVFDCSTGSGGKADSYFEVSMKAIHPKDGQYVALNGTPGFWMKRSFGMLKENQTLILADTNADHLKAIADLMGSANLKPVFTVKPFTEDGVKEAFDMLKSRRTKGKIVVNICA